MQLSNQQTLPVNQAQAWEALNDTSLLQAAIPGCESLTAIGENEYEMAVVAAIGPVKAKFKGKMKLADIVAPTSYTIHFEGQGGAAGHGKGSAEVRLEAAGETKTVLHYSAQASVGGKIAQIGSRLIDMAAAKLAGEFFEKFTAALVARHAPPAAEGEGEGETAEKKGWLGRVFGKKDGEAAGG